MMKTKIKVCGLMSERDIGFANILMPDFIGFIFAGNSRRYVCPDKAAKLREKLLPSVMATGVFVDEKLDKVAGIVSQGAIDIVQLHGEEDDDYIVTVRKMTGRPVIKAYSIAGAEDVEKALRSSADYILLDNGKGGTGKTFEWLLAIGIERPFFLAGGLDAHNVRAALATADPYAVDVSSGVEKDGVKDFEKMKSFMNAVRGYQR